MKSDIEAYFLNTKKWPEELAELRRILLVCDLEEQLKWRAPCYVFADRNIAILGELKNYCMIGFFKGVLLQDSVGLLEAPGANSRSARRICFTDVETIRKHEDALKDFVRQAVEVEKSGAKVDLNAIPSPDCPDELEEAFRANPALKQAFASLTPGRQRAYLLHFSSAKQAKTRQARIQKNESRIIAGKGLNDCTCGLSQRLPACDGSHKQLKATR